MLDSTRRSWAETSAAPKTSRAAVLFPILIGVFDARLSGQLVNMDAVPEGHGLETIEGEALTAAGLVYTMEQVKLYDPGDDVEDTEDPEGGTCVRIPRDPATWDEDIHAPG